MHDCMRKKNTHIHIDQNKHLPKPAHVSPQNKHQQSTRTQPIHALQTEHSKKKLPFKTHKTIKTMKYIHIHTHTQTQKHMKY